MSGVRKYLVLPCLMGVFAGSGFAAEVGAPIEAAPKVADSRIQMWPSAAWSEAAKCWLVAWREGDITENETDIWCARISAEGKMLDPAGIKVCTAKDRQERPKVVSDGKDFLIVWDDFRNGKDYDIYAARVRGDGKVLDADGVLVAGGENNQCRSAAAFAGDNYVVVWQAFVGNGIAGEGDGTGYSLHGMRLGKDGGALGKPVALAGVGNKAQTFNPVLATVGDGINLIAMASGDKGNARGRKYVNLFRINPYNGESAGVSFTPPREVDQHAIFSAVAGSKTGGLFLTNAPTKLEFGRLDVSGKPAGEKTSINFALSIGPPPLITAAFAGDRYLVTMDRAAARGKGSVQVKVHGLMVPAAGDLNGAISEKNTFVIAGDGDKDQMQGFAAAGPKGTCLVVYCEVRGADNTKVLARIVK